VEHVVSNSAAALREEKKLGVPHLHFVICALCRPICSGVHVVTKEDRPKLIRTHAATQSTHEVLEDVVKIQAETVLCHILDVFNQPLPIVLVCEPVQNLRALSS
jgi:hypothetical protein